MRIVFTETCSPFRRLEPLVSGCYRDDRVFFDPALKVGPQIATALAASGVIGRAMPQGDILGFAPPLCLTREEADTIVAKTADAVKSVLASL